ncbi:hypothetical protein [Corynebacterium flavescens]|uniref:hypothetical protein n=1 Tax=Corynebacterium flavescens TaxID=28028 RepID=UPI002897BEBC|nr:hypothetical protein [Corynebacterium flavescens]
MDSVKAVTRAFEKVDFQPGQSVWVVEVLANGRLWLAQVERTEYLSRVTRVWAKASPGYSLPASSEVAWAVSLAALDVIKPAAFGEDPLKDAVRGGLSLETRAVLAGIMEQLCDEIHDREIAATDAAPLQRLISTLGIDAINTALDAIKEIAAFYQQRPEVLAAKVKRREKDEANPNFIDLLDLPELHNS